MECVYLNSWINQLGNILIKFHVDNLETLCLHLIGLALDKQNGGVKLDFTIQR